MKSRYRRIGSGLLVLAGVGLYAFLLTAPRLPPPSGSYAIGRQPLALATRQGVDATPIAELWFPIEAEGARPVLLSFPSWTGTEIEDVFLTRDLVSHGFIVVTVRYPTAEEIAKAGFGLRGEPIGMMDFSSEQAFERTLALGDTKVRARARDASAVLDQLNDLNLQQGPFSGRLDLDRIGIWGFSLGGAAAAQAATIDPRIKAVVNLDGWLFADAAMHGVAQPYLLMSDGSPLPQPAELSAADPVVRYTAILNQGDYDRQTAGLKQHGGYLLTIDGTTHVNFTDAAARSRFRRLTGAGALAAPRALTIIAAYLRGFFETHLLAEPSALFGSMPPPFAEAHLQHWPDNAR